MKPTYFAVALALLCTAGEAGPLPVMPQPPAIPSSQYDWQQTGIVGYGLQPDGLKLYGFKFTITNVGTTPLVNVYDIIPHDPAVNFGITDGTWNPALMLWEADTAAGHVVAKPYNIAGFVDAATPEYPAFYIAPYLAPGHSRDVELQFEFTPVVGFFQFDAYLAAVPEPATIAVMTCGLITAGWIRKRRRPQA